MPKTPDFFDDTSLLQVILAEEIGTIANIIQAASELEGDLHTRLSAANSPTATLRPKPTSSGLQMTIQTTLTIRKGHDHADQYH